MTLVLIIIKINGGIIMDIESYCETMERQLTGWKAKLHDVIRGAEKMPEEEKTQFGPSLSRLNGLMDEMDQGLMRLTGECPIEWSTQRKAIEDRFGKMQRTLAQLSEKVGLPDSIAWL
jgi:hypothetical protein